MEKLNEQPLRVFQKITTKNATTHHQFHPSVRLAHQHQKNDYLPISHYHLKQIRNKGFPQMNDLKRNLHAHKSHGFLFKESF